MRSRVQWLPVVGLAILLLALPGIGLAGNRSAKPTSPAIHPTSVARQVEPPAGTFVAAPTVVPGASMLTLGGAEVTPWALAAGSTLIHAGSPGFVVDYYYTSDTAAMIAPIGLPAGATIWQIDGYGYRSGAGTQFWFMRDEDPAGRYFIYAGSGAHSSGGPGLVQATITFPSGYTIASGHTVDVGINSPTDATNGFVGAIVQYTLPTLSLVPMTPVRVFDSRFVAFGGTLHQFAPRTINVKDAINVATGVVTTSNAIPAGARAIAFTITVTGTGVAGYVAVLPGPTTTVTASTINWSGPGATIAAGGIVSLGTGADERKVTLVVGGGGTASTDVIVDITGYYQ